MNVRKITHVIALVVSAALLAWTSLTYMKLRTTRHGMMWLLPKLSAGAFSIETALVGVAGAVVGTLSGLVSVAVGYALVALAAGIPVVRTWLTPEVFTKAFGGIEPAEERSRCLVRQRWGVRLAAVPEARVQRDIPFSAAPEMGCPLLCDIWQPALEVPVSGLGLVYLHGGAWTVLDKDCGTRTLFRHLAAQGHVVMDVAYRLYPETDITGMVGDAKRAVTWLKAHGAQYGVDPDHIVLGGASAGGHIAILAAYTPGHSELTPADVRSADTSVRGVLGWYSPVDLAACYEHYENAALAEMIPDKPDWNTAPSPWMRKLLGANADRLALQNGPAGGRLDWIVGGSPQQVPERYALLSPITYVHAGCPPTLLMQGRDDIIVPPGPAFEMREKLKSVGVQAAVLMLPYADHAFDLFTDWSPAARQALWHTERFLALIAVRVEPGASGRDRLDKCGVPAAAIARAEAVR